MKDGFSRSRRRSLQRLAALLGAASFPIPLSAALPPSRSSYPAFARAMDRLLTHRDSAAAIGTAYLRQFAAERSAEALQEEILRGIPETGPTVNERSLLRRIEMDFELGEIVKLEGWLLSRTEARLCGLCKLDSLSQG
jgi:hypothetical protein